MADFEEQKLDEVLDPTAISSPYPKQEIMYYRPMFHRRVLANLIDIFLFVMMLVFSFTICRLIVSSTPEYKNNFNRLDEIRLNSGIYIKNQNEIVSDIITVLNSDTANNNEYKKSRAKQAIDQFLSYSLEVCEATDYEEIAKNYRDYFLADSLIYNNSESPFNGAKLFVLNESNEVVENPDLFAPGAYVPNIYYYYYANAYAPYIDSNLQGYLVTKIPQYYDLVKYFSNTLIFVDILPAFLFSGILVYYVPTLFFTRGRCTLGKALYRIGLVDQRVLSPTFARATARFTIFYFAELILSVFTFGVPFLISFTMMVVTKEKKGFPDYMLGTTEIDMSRTKVYKSFDEVDLEKINSYKEPVDFKVRNFD